MLCLQKQLLQDERALGPSDMLHHLSWQEVLSNSNKACPGRLHLCIGRQRSWAWRGTRSKQTDGWACERKRVCVQAVASGIDVIMPGDGDQGAWRTLATRSAFKTLGDAPTSSRWHAPMQTAELLHEAVFSASCFCIRRPVPLKPCRTRASVSSLADPL